MKFKLVITAALAGSLCLCAQESRPCSAGALARGCSSTPIASSKLLVAPPLGAPLKTNSLPAVIAISPDGRYAVTVNNGRGTPETRVSQSLAVLDLTTNKLADFPDPRFAFDIGNNKRAAQSMYFGLAFSTKGDEIYVSVGSLTDPEGAKPPAMGNGIAVYSFRDGQIAPLRFMKIAVRRVPEGKHATQMNQKAPAGFTVPYPAGLAIIPTAAGDRLVIANNVSDSALVMNASTGAIEQTFDLSAGDDIPSMFPYGVTVTPDHRTAYVSLWNSDAIAELDLASGKVARRISLLNERPQPARSSAHATAMTLSADGRNLLVALTNRDDIAVVDRTTGKIAGHISTRLPGQKFGGAYPIALALTADNKRLYVANAATNSVSAFDLAWRNGAFAKATFVGALPTEWYPLALELAGNDLLITTGKARGTGPNGHQPPVPGGHATRPFRYIADMIYGSIARVHLADIEPKWPSLTSSVLKANRLTGAPPRRIRFSPTLKSRWPIRHVIYIIRENRTYDQVLGDLGVGDGDPTLTLYGEDVTPNAHALARQFGVLDNFYASAEVSAPGHVWSTAAITSDYTEKTWPINYRGNERTYDFEGHVGNESPIEQGIPDLDEPGTGFLWANAARHHITYRHYGEFIESVWCSGNESWELSPSNTAVRNQHCTGRDRIRPGDPLTDAPGAPASPYPWEIPVLATDIATKPELVGHFDPRYGDFRTTYPDQLRADEFLREFNEFVSARKKGDRAHELPQLTVMRLPNDHTNGTTPERPTPVAAVADNDLALGRIVEAVSHSPYWNDTAIVVLEDDAQDGPDHVDARRSPALVISKYSPAPQNGRPFVESGFYTTVHMIRTLEDLLHLAPMNQNDAYAAPMASLFSGSGNQQPFKAITTNRDNGTLYKMNPPKSKNAQASAAMDWTAPDRINEAALNKILWEDRKGDEPMPEPKHRVFPK